MTQIPRSGRPRRPRADRGGEQQIPHGTAGGYSNHHCNCADCRRAWREQQKEYRERNPERDRTTGRLK